jgi:hypothetical protein
MGWDTGEDPFGDGQEAGGGVREPIELVGTSLRLTGTIALGRFGRLTDLINALSGYVRVHDARLLRPNGDPTDVTLSEILVDQDEISYFAQREATAPGPAIGFVDQGFGGNVETRKPREYIMFTPGHTVTGKVHVFGAMDVATFVDASDPRYIPVTDATTRSLTDRRIVGHFPFVLINRTQMIAAAEIGRPEETPPEDTSPEEGPGEAATPS